MLEQQYVEFSEKFTTPCNVKHDLSFGAFSVLTGMEMVIMLSLCYERRSILKMSGFLCTEFSCLVSFSKICRTEQTFAKQVQPFSVPPYAPNLLIAFVQKGGLTYLNC